MKMANEYGRRVGNIPCALVIGVILAVSILFAGGIIVYFLALMRVFDSGFSSEEHHWEYENWENTVAYAPQSSAPEWTPDGSHILFPSGTRIYSIKPDGSLFRRVADLAGGAGGLRISPNGSRIAYSTQENRQRLPYYIESSNLDGSDRHKLTEKSMKEAPSVLSEVAPAWSPDGQHIAFARFKHGDSEGRGIYVMEADGSNERRLYSFSPDLPDRASEEGYRWGPVWSPDGKKLTFVIWEGGRSSSVRDNRRDGLYSIGMDHHDMFQVYVTRSGTAVSSGRLYYLEQIISPPAWSPDGQKIAFISRSFNFGEDGEGAAVYEITLHTINPNGSGLRTVAEISEFDFDSNYFESLSWSPNGTDILFASSTGIYIASADTGVYRRVARGGHASWSPDGSKIAVVMSQHTNNDITLLTKAPDGSDVQILLEGTSTP